MRNCACLVLLKVVRQDVVLAQADAARDGLLAVHDQPQQRALPAPIGACSRAAHRVKGCSVCTVQPPKCTVLIKQLLCPCKELYTTPMTVAGHNAVHFLHEDF